MLLFNFAEHLYYQALCKQDTMNINYRAILCFGVLNNF